MGSLKILTSARTLACVRDTQQNIPAKQNFHCPASVFDGRKLPDTGIHQANRLRRSAACLPLPPAGLAQ
jgi:hypothetical protein